MERHRYAELEVVVKENCIEIWHHYKQYLVIGVNSAASDEKERILVNLKQPVLWVDGLPVDLDHLDVNITTQERDLVGLPKHRTRSAKSELIRAPRATRDQKGGSSDDRISERKKNVVLTAILDSFLDNPHQSKEETRAETHRIAKRYSEPLYAVAGVRAALTRGTYGDQDQLLVERRRNRLQTRRAQAAR